MDNRLATRLTLGAVLTLASVSCTVSSSDVPSIAGPSEFARSLQIIATPDSIRQDGFASSAVVVTARDPQGAAVPNLAIRLDILPADYGTLSTTTIVTGSDGRAQATYTSPPRPPLNAPLGTCSASGITLPGYCVYITATPIGASFYGEFSSRVTQIHLVPPGLILPPADPTAPIASFTFSPPSPRVGGLVTVNATASQAIAGRRIVQYIWSWGDGDTATKPGPLEDHDYAAAGLYPIVLTVVDDAGVSGATVQTINVQP